MISSVIYFKDDDRVVYHDSSVEYIEKTFLPGFYEFLPTGCFSFNIDEVHTPFSSKENNMIIKSCTDFFSSPKIKKKINAMGFSMKMGVLLYGKPGTGKTTIMNYIGSYLVHKKDAIVCVVDDKESLNTTIPILKNIREIQKNPIIVILDEVDALLTNKESEATLKRFLDGSDSIDNVLVLAATNYIEYIPETFTKRESRFRIIEEIKGIDNLDTIKNVVTNMLTEADSMEYLDKVMSKVKVGDTLDLIKNRVMDAILGNKIKTSERPQIAFVSRSYEMEDPVIEFFPLDWSAPNKLKGN